MTIYRLRVSLPYGRCAASCILSGSNAKSNGVHFLRRFAESVGISPLAVEWTLEEVRA